MIDIYQQALNGQQGSRDSMVQAVLNASRGGSYQPYAPGTPTLGSRQLDETARSNDMDNVYKNKALAETGRTNDMENAYRLAALNETIRSNDLTNSYQNKSLAAQIAENEARNNAKSIDPEAQARQAMSAAMGGIIKAFGDGLSPSQIKKNVIAQSQALASSGLDPQAVLQYVDSVHAQTLAAEKDRLQNRPFLKKAGDAILPGGQFR